MDRLEAMSMLVAVTEAGSFSAASKALKVPLATLSRKIAELERQLGTRLLLRTTRKLSLTDAGLGYVAASRRILEQVEEAEREATGEYTQPKGELVITAPLMFGRLHVLPVASDFLARFPDINIRLLLADHILDLIEEQVDMAVRIGRLPDSSMVATPIGHIRIVTCASPSLLTLQGMPQRPQDLLQMPCITADAPNSRPNWRYACPDNPELIPVAVQSRLSVTNSDSAVQAAIRGVGVTRVLHYQAAEALQDGKLQIILPEYEPPPLPVHLLHVSRGLMPLKMRRFLDFAAPRLRESVKKVSVI
ncbi:LysR family transcriptional regulator [Bowmanella dokdonensis]|uniref:LysR family transcriptional regulator n=1 Tax=Bowmanella dokdonensis TaxID=751969 RepID=A0A939DS38_9ALTE|nr:LysR family transcriptional regulator [Bowmanella dokdonensis]MBN7827765.1 LysR family transcriptional regulator [Bowmanella dokdonensis]